VASGRLWVSECAPRRYPIVQLPGHPAYILKAPPFGGDAGTLRIAPTAEDLAPFQTLQLTRLNGDLELQGGIPAWDDTAVPVCVTDTTTTSTSYCAPALLDTGTPSSDIQWEPYTGTAGTFATGSNVQVQIGSPSAPVGDYTFVVGTAPQAGLDLVNLFPAGANSKSSINLGTAVFFRYDVYFDQNSGALGLASK
jgi:hypothetical protein